MLSKSLVTDRLTAWHLFAAAALGALGVAVTWNAWTEIIWFARRDEEASHIWLVLPVALWMILIRRMRFRHCKPSGTIIGPLIVGGGWALGSYGFNHGGTVFYHLG